MSDEPALKIVAEVERSILGRDWIDADTARALHSSLSAIASVGVVHEKVASAQHWIGIFASDRKSIKWGRDQVKSFILADLRALRSLLERSAQD